MVKKIESVSFSDCVVEYVYEMDALKRSKSTIREYSTTFAHFERLIGGDIPLNKITRMHIVKFLKMIGDEPFKPGGSPHVKPKSRSKKTLKNYHVGLSALWTWALKQGYASEHVVQMVEAPKPEKKEILPYSDEEVVLMVEACSQTKRWKNNPLTRSERQTAVRDKAILLMLIDSGVRNKELRELKMEDVDLARNTVRVRMGKGAKERYVGFGAITKKALYMWLRKRPEEAEWHGDYFFTSMLNYKGHQIQSDTLTKLIKRIAERAEVPNANVHRFRHTAAVRRLQAGMNAFQLKIFMGHQSMKSTLRYVHLAGLDMEEVLKRSNPADRLKIR